MKVGNIILNLFPSEQLYVVSCFFSIFSDGLLLVQEAALQLLMGIL